LGNQLLHRSEFGTTYQENGYVFPDLLGEPLNPMKLTRAFQSLAKQQGAQKAKLHDLRHLHATVLLQNGESILLVAKRLGHPSVSPTGDVYGHLLPGRQQEAADAFAKIMGDA
jgi:integrase